MHSRSARARATSSSSPSTTSPKRCAGPIAGGAATFGTPTDVLTTGLIRQVYGVTAEVFDSPSGSPTLSLVRVSCPTATTFTRPRRAAS